MSPHNWETVKRLFDGAAGLSAEDRPAYLDRNGPHDPAVIAEVESLLDAHDRPQRAFDRAAWEAPIPVLDSWCGRRVDQYDVGAEIGRGGMGVVYAARDKELGRAAALKFLSEELAGDRDFLKRFRGEARAASALNHPNVCTIYGLGYCEGHPYIAMELLEGRNLRQRLESGPLPLDELLAISADIAAALDAAHQSDLVHRDIKPANVFITNRGQVKVLDFGLAKEAGANHDQGAADTALTATGLALGTLGYMSPEQARGEVLDARGDLFSFGAILYEMATGRRAFAGSTPALILDGVLNRQPNTRDAAIPEDLERIISKALAKDRSARYQTAAEMRADLLALRRDSTTGAKRQQRAAAWWQGKRVLLAAAAFVVLALALLLSWLPSWTAKPYSSLAILPFSNETADADREYLVDNIAESLIQKLSLIPSLRVMARSTVFGYKGRVADPREAGRALRVQAVLTGRVRERGGLMVVQAELVNISDGAHIWGAGYERAPADLQAVQDEIAAEVAESLHLKMNQTDRRRLSQRYTRNSSAYQIYAQGRYFLNKRTRPGLQKAAELFQQALTLDPGYALAHAGLADAYILLHSYGHLPTAVAAEKAETSAKAALAIDSGLAEAYTSLAYVASMFRWDFAAAGEAYRKAVELNPSYPTAHQWYALHLTAMGQRDQARSQIRQAIEIDPASLILQADYALVLLLTGAYDEAEAQSRKTLELDPGFTTAHWYLGSIHTERQRFEAALAEFDIGIRATFGDVLAATKTGYNYAKWGKRAAAIEKVRLLEQRANTNSEASCGAAVIHGVLGNRDQAIGWLEKAYVGRAACMVWIRASPELDTLRDDARFKRIENQMRFVPARRWP